MSTNTRAYARAVQAARMREGIWQVSKVDGHEYGMVMLDINDNPLVTLTTCGTCGRTWNDALITGVTPAPSARCPFEHKHHYGDDA